LQQEFQAAGGIQRTGIEKASGRSGLARGLVIFSGNIKTRD
jgi:hypothetical protein